MGVCECVCVGVLGPGTVRATRFVTPTNEEPHVRASVQLLAVHFAQDAPRGHHVEQADDNPGVLSPQIAHRIGRIGEERLSRDDLDGRLLAAVLQVFDRLRKCIKLLSAAHPRARERIRAT